MSDIERILGRCVADDETGCWLWRGAVVASNGGTMLAPRIWAADYSLDQSGGTKTVQTGNRAAWHASRLAPIPAGNRVFKGPVCSNPMCVNPEHLRCGTTAQWGESVAAKGDWKRQSTRVNANRATGRARSAITPAIALELRTSTETGRAFSKRTGIAESVISKAKRGQMKSIQAGNPFLGLIT